MLRQYQQYENYTQPSSGLKYILYGLIGLVILFLLGYFFLSSGGARCGNGLCERGEDCETCGEDCGCGEGAVCQKGQCVYTSPPLAKMCGNGKCDAGETMIDCCEDCGCEQGQQCIDNSCQYPFSLTDKEVEEKMNNYLDRHGYNNYIIDVGAAWYYQDKLIKSIHVHVNGITVEFGIDEFGNIYEYGETL